jgi:hypothetical protein
LVTDTTSRIDSFFDAFDSVVDTADRVLNGSKRKPKAKSDSPSPMATPMAIALRKARFRIDEVTDASTGAVLYIVTDGATARCEFSSRVTAQQILEKLETT